MVLSVSCKNSEIRTPTDETQFPAICPDKIDNRQLNWVTYSCGLADTTPPLPDQTVSEIVKTVNDPPSTSHSEDCWPLGVLLLELLRRETLPTDLRAVARQCF